MFRNYMPTRDQVQARVFGQSREETTTEERTRLAVCKILRGQDKEIVGCGVLVFDPDFDDHISGLSKYCIITSKEVIEKENFLDGSINQVKFSKEPREKCFDLNGFSKSVKDVPSGLVLIFIDPRHRDLNHGYLMKKKCSILSKSPLLMTNSGQDRQLFCYVANKCYNIVKSSGEDGEYVLKATTVESEPDEIPNGTVILQGANKDVRAVGVFNVVDKTNMVVSPIWLKSSISDILADTSTSAIGQPPNPSTGGQAPIPSTAGGAVSANGTTPSPAGPSSSGGQAPTPSTAGGVVSANGTSPSPAGPSSNGGGQAPTPSTAGGVVSANGTTPSPADPSSNDGEAPTPSTPGGVVSANGTTPSPAGPSSNGERCNLRTTKVSVNGTAVIYHTLSPRNKVPPPMSASIIGHNLNERAPGSDGNNPGNQQLSFDGSTTKPQNEVERSLLSLTSPSIKKQGTVGDGKLSSGNKKFQQKKEVLAMI